MDRKRNLPPLEDLDSDALRALNQAGFAVLEAAAFDSTLQTILDTARRLARARYGALAIADDEGAVAPFITSGLTRAQREKIGTLAEGRALLDLMLQRKEPVLLNRTEARSPSIGLPAGWPSLTGFLGVPIALNDRAIGGLCLTNKRGGGAFDRQDERLLRAFAAHASLAIDYSRRLHDERSRSEEWRTLFELGREITEALHPEEVLESIVSRARGFLHADMAFLTALTDDRAHLKTTAWDGLQSRGMRNLHYRPDQGMAQRILARGSAFIVDDYRRDPRLRQPLSDAAAEEGIVSVVGSPLAVHGELLGILYAANRTPARFNERDGELLDAFASLAAIATEHSRLYAATSDALQQKVSELEAVTRALKHRSAQVLTAQEDERRRLARDLHDQTAQELTTLRVRLRLLDKARNTKEMREGLAVLREMAGQALDGVRAMSAALRPRILDDLGLAAAVRSYSEHFSAQWRIPVRLSISGLEARLPATVELAGYRVMQEALQNVVKHAEAVEARVDLQGNGSLLRLRISDNGRGFDTRRRPAGMPTEALGIPGMRERAELVGGRLRIESRPGRGTTVTAELPIEQELP